jgi:hypothetical protein
VCEWEPIFSRLLAVLAASASIYVQLMLEGLRKDAADQRLVTRELMVEFLLIDRAAVNAGTLRADGFDSDIAALCDIPPVQ